MKVLVIDGPNLNMLGNRESAIYGNKTLVEIHSYLKDIAQNLNVKINFFQSNHEGEIVEKIQQSLNLYDYFIINAGAYTHTSIAIRDALMAVKIPAIEVHLSNIYAREEFRKHSYLAPVCQGQICGFGFLGYEMALRIAVHRLRGDIK